MKLSKLKQRLFQDKKFVHFYFKKNIPDEIAQMVIEARAFRGVTQEKLSKMIDTKQPSIARIENGKSMPSLTMINKIAEALNVSFIITI